MFLLFFAFANITPNFAQVNNWFYRQILNGIYNDDVKLLSIDEFENEIDDYVIYDSRSIEEFEVSHIKNAQFIDFDSFKEFDFSELNTDQKILVYCSIGARSQTVVEHLIKNGYTNVYNLEGGIFEWVNNDKNIIDTAGENTENIHAFSKAWGIWLQKGNKVY